MKNSPGVHLAYSKRSNYLLPQLAVESIIPVARGPTITGVATNDGMGTNFPSTALKPRVRLHHPPWSNIFWHFSKIFLNLENFSIL